VPGLQTWWKLDVAELSPGAPSDAVEAVGADLTRRLAEPHRRYHTGHHVIEMFWALEDLERAGELTARQSAVARVAACFHDAVYVPVSGPGDNERESAELAERTLRALQIDDADVGAVRALVLASQDHELSGDHQGGLAASFHDADLWILSAPPERYAEYTTQVRAEYAAVPDAAFRAGRAAVLRPFLERESIYATGLARREWEPRAREQLAAEIRALQA
jgi:predicted metal-dependent HD superfamily phosphohydrolase